MAVTQATAAPYAPTRTMIDIIERHRDRGLPKPINAETLQRAGLVTESLMSRTLQTCTTLDLIDEAGNPTAVFEGIRLAPEAEYKKRLEDWLKFALPLYAILVALGAGAVLFGMAVGFR